MPALCLCTDHADADIDRGDQRFRCVAAVTPGAELSFGRAQARRRSLTATATDAERWLAVSPEVIA